MSLLQSCAACQHSCWRSKDKSLFAVATTTMGCATVLLGCKMATKRWLIMQPHRSLMVWYMQSIAVLSEPASYAADECAASCSASTSHAAVWPTQNIECFVQHTSEKGCCNCNVTICARHQSSKRCTVQGIADDFSVVAFLCMCCYAAAEGQPDMIE
jgi:hypothetical protein